MTFWTRSLPILICFLVGLAAVVQYYVPHPHSETAFTEANDWLIIISGFAALLGLGSLIQVHGRNIARQQAGWGYSAVMFAALIGTVIAGIVSEGKTTMDAQGALPAFGWVYNYMMFPLQGTMFAIIAFFVASVAFRSFRAKNLESGLLLVAALILLLGRVPLGEMLWDRSIGMLGLGAGQVVDWIMENLNLAARRGILLGITLGVLATSLKILFGIEKNYLGGGE